MFIGWSLVRFLLERKQQIKKALIGSYSNHVGFQCLCRSKKMLVVIDCLRKSLMMSLRILEVLDSHDIAPISWLNYIELNSIHVYFSICGVLQIWSIAYHMNTRWPSKPWVWTLLDKSSRPGGPQCLSNTFWSRLTYWGFIGWINRMVAVNPKQLSNSSSVGSINVYSLRIRNTIWKENHSWALDWTDCFQMTEGAIMCFLRFLSVLVQPMMFRFVF